LDELCERIESSWDLTVENVAELLSLTPDEVRDELDERAQRRPWPKGPFLDRELRRLAFVEWVRLTSGWRTNPRPKVDYRRIAKYWLPDGWMASTVWSGGPYTDEEPPAIFETMVLAPDDDDRGPIGPFRWLNEESAREGHLQCIAAYLELAPWPHDDRGLAEHDPEWAQRMVSTEANIRAEAVSERDDVIESHELRIEHESDDE
jgi:hypothetical protein